MGIEVETIPGEYGEYRVLVDGETVVDGGPMVTLGLMPSSRTVVDKVRARLTSDEPEPELVTP